MELCRSDVLSYIEKANDHELNEIISAVNRRFQSHFPDWEVIYLSCPKNDPSEREKTLTYINKYFRRETD